MIKDVPSRYFRRRGRGRALLDRPAAIGEPISAEIFSVERLEQHAESLAKAQEVSATQTAGVSLRGRLRTNALTLDAAFRTLIAGIRRGRAVTPAAEWLVDNYYIVDEHIRAVRRDLPSGFYKQLPKLSHGPLRGYPRVYGLAWAIVAHSDSRFELDTLFRFCRAYQRVQPLKIGELWAITITLRVVLIENLTRLAGGIVSRLALRERADALADEWLADSAAQMAPSTAARAAEAQRLGNAFGAQLFQRLRDHDPETTPALAWLHRTFAAQGTTADEIVHSEHQRQGAVNLSVRNVITSLRLISAVDWAEFFESVSLVDELMRERSSFAAFDFSTRDLYRHAIEEVARRSHCTEMDVARRALDLAERAAVADARAPEPRHPPEPGYYLVAAGRPQLERELGYRTPWSQRLTRCTRAAGVLGYAGSIVALSIAMTAAMVHVAGPPGPALLLAAAIVALALLAASDIAVSIVNIWVTRLCDARVLPGLELVDGVPTELRSVVVVPILLTSIADIDESVHRIEVHYLATQDGDIRFALLSDWMDSATENTAEDAELLAAAAAGIARLNRVHGSVHGDDRFLLLHRKRLWNRAQGCWMGWERKRGKLHEFNLLLRGSRDTSFLPVGGRPPQAPAGVRYVISLDADTRLPRGAALSLIGKMAHPLNRPVVDTARQRVTSGYGILQPRVTPSLPVGHQGSFFQRVFSGPSGIDPYAFAVSDVYQDMFGEGSYSGKGIYDVNAFEATLANRVGDNRLLSHDLFEGIYARCGLASDIEVVEEYPPRYAVATARQHRWTRGDWQLLPWVLGAYPSLPPLGRWKMFDNLRRSLLVPAVLAGFALCWLGSAPLGWSLFFLASIVLPPLLPFIVAQLPRFADFTREGYVRTLSREAKAAAALIGLRLVFWADQAWSMSDAIVRTLYRLCISRRNLLQWTTTAQSHARASDTMLGAYRRMSGSLLLVSGLTLLLLAAGRGVPWIAVPLLLTWLCAPLIARSVSLPARAARRQSLTADDRHRLRIMARQTWSFFDTFVTAEQNMLPPDNFQEIPNAIIANRTSPTNIGLYLLSVVSAREFGWIGTFDALDRLEAAFSSLDKLERYRGHFYNWYDTHDLRPLEPKYISTVDSGNFAGHLLALEGVCRQWSAESSPTRIDVSGMLDTLEQMQEVARVLNDGRRNYGVSPRQLDTAVEVLRASLNSMNSDSRALSLAAILQQAEGIRDIAQALTDERPEGSNAPLLHWSGMLRTNVLSHLRDSQADAAAAARLGARLEALGQRARVFALSMEFGFLLEPERQLLTIGYRVADRTQDPSCYDLLASEARLASFVAIAKGDLPVRHWFRLGRTLTPVDGGSALVSWSGSMFEYLMPILVMREPEGSLLGETSRLIVKRQIEYGSERNLPWGVSESAFNARDREFTYQYSSFGVPGLGLQRGLGDEAVVAPYATGLAAMVDPAAAIRNFERLQKLGGRGPFGWYEALDFSPARLPEGVSVVPVRAYMAHHQGMILVAIANVLKDGMLRGYFHLNPAVQATELLLQERTPRDSDLSSQRTDEVQSAPELREELTAVAPRRFTSPHHVAPRTHLLSNGNYSVMLTAAGSGYSRWRGIAVTRWREDPTCDPWGCYIFLRDVVSGQVWSAGYQPVGREPDNYDVAFFEDHAEITRRDGRILTSTEILVSSEDDAEVRRVSVTNQGSRVSEIELTTYAEVVLAAADADSAHPAFSKLFVRTEFIADTGALLATRRGREPDDPQFWMAHLSALEGVGIGGLQFETDRARFLGRGRDLRNAVSIMDARPLSNTAGTVLDPVLALRRRVRIAPGETARIAFWTSISASREDAIALIDKHRDMAAFERAKTLAWTQAQVQLRYLGIDFEEAQQFQRIANRVLYADFSLRASRDILEKNALGPSALWPQGISGDLPIVLVRIDDESDMEIVRQLLRAHEYWRLKRLAVDLVILNERPPSYASELQQALDTAIRTAQSRRDEDGTRRGAVFSLRSDLLLPPVRDLLQTAARAIFVARRGTLSDQLARLREPDPVPRQRARSSGRTAQDAAPRTTPQLEFFNGLGGFAGDGREYVVVLDEGQWTPAPWINVIANAQFGCQVSADGSGSAWSLNAQQNQITPWCNDPVSDAPAEAIYLRDEDNGDLWSATPLPIREPSLTFVVRHGFGYSRFEHTSHGVSLDLVQFVPLEDPLKISRLKVVNRSAQTRRLSVTHYLDWVLGNQRSRTAAFIVTEIEPKTRALLARNPWSTDFHARVAFMDMGGRQQACTADRAEFIGRHGSLDEPKALLDTHPLSNRVGGALDPCGAMQTKLTLSPGESAELTFLIGEEASSEAAVGLIERYRTRDLDAALKEVTDFWDQTLGTIQVKTPDRSLDILVNGWLLYQTLACRVWARTAFYQSSGAYGFRDQLQDVMALMVSKPNIAREHILRAAGRQFEEGDVQHWWLPTTGQGVKTRVSDDRIWLPFVLAHYLEVTEDFAVLDEQVPFLSGGPLPADSHEAFSAPESATAGSLFEHCVRALDSSLAIGSHGLPLFGTGDWNDGMNRVGAAGRGESVWLGWFLHAALLRFAPIAERRGAAAAATAWRKHAFALQQAIEREAWDGDWYRRGYFDDGTPLGSVASDECRIDSIAQSWAVISGAAEPERAMRAMSAVNAQLVSRSDGLVQLFTPAFDHTAHDPGYIKAYPPGIRENGGQYTHAAMWSTLAFALLGDGDRAGELFSILNPINHASTRAGIHRYKVEPYVACADVYSSAQHVGRGGWTWYTGSAGWMYRTAVEGILGIQLRGRVLAVNPCIPRAWAGFEITYKFGTSRYRIAVENPHGVSRGIMRATLDGQEISRKPCEIALVDDGNYHYGQVTLG
ncbi:MAG: GH36-type glycosyl hydrolase domain-containing protein [Steroidobacteraceae bacterium]